ncbi:hypothetical protein ACKGJO_06100 [Gracilimonas sp. Q87]|uniref:hypothetical protein n=1 Tax=Gracilimonas sp. Q87 TaxID=3384766 RepID=UPI0039840AF1
MSKSAILKIAGIVLIPFILMLVGAFFLYPQLNEEKFNEIVTNFEEQQEEQFKNDLQKERNTNAVNQKVISKESLSDSMEVYVTTEVDSVNIEELPDSIQNITSKTESEIHRFEQSEIRLHGIIDSLYAVIEELEAQIELLSNPVEEKTELDPKEFSERVKSLLNLEEDELRPILEKMTKDQIVRLYDGGGTIQRQKILRSLGADEAAELMTEIMR